MGLIATIILGLIAGWLTGLVMKGGGYGVIGDIVLGIIGAFIGGWLTSLLTGVNMISGLNITSLIVAVIGAVIVVAIYRAVTSRRVVR